MKRKYKTSLLLASFILVLTSSCQDTLNIKPISLISTVSFWTSEDDAKGALSGMYVNLRNSAQGIFMVGDQRSEIYEGGAFGEGTFSLYRNVMTPDNPGHPNWSGFYRTINSANLLLKYVPGISFRSENTKNDVLAQAYTMRAYMYFVMTKTWGDLIIRTEPTESADAEQTLKARSSKEEVFKLIKADLEMALKLFSNNNFASGRNTWSKPGANTLKGDVYLWTAKQMSGGAADFNTALAALNEVTKADVMLLPNFAGLFRMDNKGNKENIMSIRFQDLEATNHFWFMWIINGAVPSTIDQATRDLINPIGGGQGLMVITDLVRKQFTNDDSRKKGSFYEIFTYDKEGKPTFYSTLSMKGIGQTDGGNRRFTSDVLLYRYAEVLLMIAEAKNALRQDPSPEMNIVRRRAYGANFPDHVFVNGSKEANDAAILKERLFELIYEGKRWWDLVRFGKAFDLVPALKDRKGKNDLLLFPIAETVLSQEPLVKQNPGY